MKTTGAFDQDGVTAVLENTVLNDVRRLMFAERFPFNEAQPRVQNWQWIFVNIAAFSSRVTGLDWSPPEMDADSGALEASFYQLVAQLDPQTFIAWNNALIALIRGVSPAEDQSSGDADEDFLANAPPTSENTSTP